MDSGYEKILVLVKHMIEEDIKKYKDARDGSLKAWDSNYKTNEYKRRGLQEFLDNYTKELYDPLIQKIKNILDE